MFVGLSGVELAVQKCLYWPDGRRKKHLASQPIDTTRDFNRQLVEALVDKYNEDHNLLGVCSLSLPLLPSLLPRVALYLSLIHSCNN
uniref:Uncharacterized protein n=1 Tax=Aegilops tauschii subsp. strangulata TaxID=200361 RepID=A0A453B837_AEGTS